MNIKNVTKFIAVNIFVFIIFFFSFEVFFFLKQKSQLDYDMAKDVHFFDAYFVSPINRFKSFYDDYVINYKKY